MKKIKLTKKLNLNKSTIIELNNPHTVIGGAVTVEVGCHSTPVCCISYTCPTSPSPCKKEFTITGCVLTID